MSLEEDKVRRQNRRNFARLLLEYPQIQKEELPYMALGDIGLLLVEAKIRDLEQAQMMLNAFRAAQSKKGYNKFKNDLKKGIKRLEESA